MNKFSRGQSKKVTYTPSKAGIVKRIYVGIDPGLTGGIAFIVGQKIEVYNMPIKARHIDCESLKQLFFRCVYPRVDIFVMIEELSYNPKWGKAAVIKSATELGKIHCVLELGGISYQTVTPRTWKAAMFKGKTKGKQLSIDHVVRKYPQVNLFPGRKTTPHDGIADAICLAEYGRLYA